MNRFLKFLLGWKLWCGTSFSGTFCSHLMTMTISKMMSNSHYIIIFRKTNNYSNMDFLDLLPTLKGCNFFSTEPILKISDVFSRWEPNSFISAVLATQNEFGVPSHAYLWARISEILQISKISPYRVGSVPAL